MVGGGAGEGKEVGLRRVPDFSFLRIQVRLLPMKSGYIFGLVVGLASQGVLSAAELLKSPDGKVEVTLSLSEGQPVWAVSYEGKEILKQGALEILHGDEKPFVFEQEKFETKMVDEKWKPLGPVEGGEDEVRNHYQEGIWLLLGEKAKETTYRIRVYDQAVALRSLVKQPTEKTTDRVQFHFAFPVPLPEHPVETPFEVTGPEGPALSILEASGWHQPFFQLVAAGENTLQTVAEPVSWSFDEAASSWRVLAFDHKPGDRLLENLNPPSQIQDLSWIQPERDFVIYSAGPGLSLPEFDRQGAPVLALSLNDLMKAEPRKLLKEWAGKGLAGLTFTDVPGEKQKAIHQMRDVVMAAAAAKLVVLPGAHQLKETGGRRTWPNSLPNK